MRGILVELFLACRYLKPKRNAVSVITLISVVGVSLGVCVLMVVLAIMTGFTDEMKSKLLETTPHIQVRNFHRGYIEDPEPVLAAARELGVEATPMMEGAVLVQKGRRIIPKAIIGLDPEMARTADFLRDMVQRGDCSLEPGKAVISYVLARELDLGVGERFLVHSPAKLSRMVSIDEGGKVRDDGAENLYLPDEFEVAGIFSAGKYDFDSKVLFAPLDDVDELFGLPWGACSTVAGRVDDPYAVESLVEALEAKLPPYYEVASWKEINRQLLNVLVVEKNMMFFVLIFIVLVAAFSITNTLITVVVQKTREIGLLRALGVSAGSVMKIFILQGFVVGFVGTVSGLALGALVIHWRMAILHAMSKVFGLEIFPKQIYMFNELPASVVPFDVCCVAVASVVLCTLGGVIPAFRAALLDPAKALRYE